MSVTTARTPKFQLGQIVATPQAIEFIRTDAILVALGRHQYGDWSETDPEDAEANNQAIITGGRILSEYRFNCHTLWILTEADRLKTTVFIPEDY